MTQMVGTALVLMVIFGMGYMLIGPPSGRALVLGAVLGMVAVVSVRWFRTRGR